MPAYNFSLQFAGLVERGEKQQTIRRSTKDAKPGDVAQLFTGQGTSAFRKIGTGLITKLVPIEIGRHANREPYACITETGEIQAILLQDALNSFAKEDGFANGEEMVAWFDAKYGLPFIGFLHLWVLDRQK